MDPSSVSVDRLRARRLRLALVGIVVVAGAALGGCGSSSPEGAGSTPGAGDGEVPLDTTPFELASPSERGSTTLPGGFLDPSELDGTTTVPIETTTTVNPPLFVPPSQEITSLCGMALSIDSLFPAEPLPPDQVGPVLAAILPNLDRYVEVAPPDARQDVEVFRDVITNLDALFREGGGRIDYPPLAEQIRLLISQSGPYAEIGARLDRIRAADARAC